MLTRNGYRSVRSLREQTLRLHCSMKSWSCLINHRSGGQLFIDDIYEDFQVLQQEYLELQKIVESLDGYPVKDPATIWGRLRLLICDLISKASTRK